MSYLHLGQNKDEVNKANMSVLPINNTSLVSVGSKIFANSHSKRRWMRGGTHNGDTKLHITKSKVEVRINLLRSICNDVVVSGVHVLH